MFSEHCQRLTNYKRTLSKDVCVKMSSLWGYIFGKKCEQGHILIKMKRTLPKGLNITTNREDQTGY